MNSNKRYAITLAYNGKNYFGWQRQPREISVQEVIEDALTKIHSNIPIPVVGCGRTDTGVHAHQYVLHVDMPPVEDLQQFVYKLNKMLPKDIVFYQIEEKEENFHARFDAKKRTYRYFLTTQKDCFQYEQKLYIHRPLDFQKMNEAAQLLIGKKDFTSFAKLHTDAKTNICDVTSAEWIQTDEHHYYFEISADRFLRNMVRSVVGTLLEVGLGNLQPNDVTRILDEKDRGKASASAPGGALFLWEVEY